MNHAIADFRERRPEIELENGKNGFLRELNLRSLMNAKFVLFVIQNNVLS